MRHVLHYMYYLTYNGYNGKYVKRNMLKNEKNTGAGAASIFPFFKLIFLKQCIKQTKSKQIFIFFYYKKLLRFIFYSFVAFVFFFVQSSTFPIIINQSFEVQIKLTIYAFLIRLLVKNIAENLFYAL